MPDLPDILSLAFYELTKVKLYSFLFLDCVKGGKTRLGNFGKTSICGIQYFPRYGAVPGLYSVACVPRTTPTLYA